MADADNTLFAPITSYEHARRVVVAMRCRNWRFRNDNACLSAGPGHSATEGVADEPRGKEAQQEAAMQCGTELKQFNNIVQGELQAMRRLQEEEEQRKGWDDMTATDEDLLRKLHARRSTTPASQVGVDHDEEEDAVPLPTSPPRSPSVSSDQASCVPRHAPASADASESPVQSMSGARDTRDSKSVGGGRDHAGDFHDVTRHISTAQAAEARASLACLRNGDGDATISVQAAKRVNGPSPPSRDPRSLQSKLETTKTPRCCPQPEVFRVEEKNSTSDDDSGQVDIPHGGMSGRGCDVDPECRHSNRDNGSDSSWSSSEEEQIARSGMGCATTSGMPDFGDEDDWAGPAVYGSDDDLRRTSATFAGAADSPRSSTSDARARSKQRPAMVTKVKQGGGIPFPMAKEGRRRQRVAASSRHWARRELKESQGRAGDTSPTPAGASRDIADPCSVPDKVGKKKHRRVSWSARRTDVLLDKDKRIKSPPMFPDLPAAVSRPFSSHAPAAFTPTLGERWKSRRPSVANCAPPDGGAGVTVLKTSVVRYSQSAGVHTAAKDTIKVARGARTSRQVGMPLGHRDARGDRGCSKGVDVLAEQDEGAWVAREFSARVEAARAKQRAKETTRLAPQS